MRIPDKTLQRQDQGDERHGAAPTSSRRPGQEVRRDLLHRHEAAADRSGREAGPDGESAWPPRNSNRRNAHSVGAAGAGMVLAAANAEGAAAGGPQAAGQGGAPASRPAVQAREARLRARSPRRAVPRPREPAARPDFMKMPIDAGRRVQDRRRNWRTAKLPPPPEADSQAGGAAAPRPARRRGDHRGESPERDPRPGAGGFRKGRQTSRLRQERQALWSSARSSSLKRSESMMVIADGREARRDGRAGRSERQARRQEEGERAARTAARRWPCPAAEAAK